MGDMVCINATDPKTKGFFEDCERMFKAITKLFGTKHERDVKKLQPFVDEINAHFEGFQQLSEEELVGKTDEFRGPSGRR